MNGPLVSIRDIHKILIYSARGSTGQNLKFLEKAENSKTDVTLHFQDEQPTKAGRQS